MCQHLLGEISTANLTFDKIDSVTLTRSELTKYATTQVPSILALEARLLLPFNSLEERIIHFNMTKSSSTSAINTNYCINASKN